MFQNKVILFNLPFRKIRNNELVNLLDKRNFNIYFCTLNEIVIADKNLGFKEKLLKSKTILVTDGMPLVWLMKLKTGFSERIYGPDFLKKYLLDNKNFTNIFIGDSNNKNYFKKFGEYLTMPMKEKFTETDFKNLVKKIKKSRGEVVWLGLGAEKQIEVADELKKRGIKKTILTVGAAFDYLSGNKKQAQKIIRNSGFEWLFRLLTEPKRLWPRYSQIIKFLINKIRINGFNFLKHI